jgi:hypothetical protein
MQRSVSSLAAWVEQPSRKEAHAYFKKVVPGPVAFDPEFEFDRNFKVVSLKELPALKLKAAPLPEVPSVPAKDSGRSRPVGRSKSR